MPFGRGRKIGLAKRTLKATVITTKKAKSAAQLRAKHMERIAHHKAKLAHHESQLKALGL